MLVSTAYRGREAEARPLEAVRARGFALSCLVCSIGTAVASATAWATGEYAANELVVPAGFVLFTAGAVLGARASRSYVPWAATTTVLGILGITVRAADSTLGHSEMLLGWYGLVVVFATSLLGGRWGLASTLGSLLGIAVVYVRLPAAEALPHSVTAAMLVALTFALVGSLDRMLADHIERIDRARRDLEEANALLAKRTDEAEAAVEAREMFVATVSHELRTPLNAILGTAQLLLEKVDDPEARDLAETVVTSGRTLQHVVGDVLQFSQLGLVGVSLALEPVPLLPFLQRVTRLFGDDAAKKQVAVVLEAADDLPERVVSDPHRLQQVLSNLLSNAIKFSDHGTIRVRAMALHGGQRLRFEVIDQGIGIPEGQLERIFEPFRQLELTRARRYEGLGLGLAITRSLVEAMEGEIGATSEVGRGTTMWFEIPVLDGGRPRSDPAIRLDAIRPKVLVVEDNAVNRKVVERQLDHLGCLVDLAENGRAALDRVALQTPDLILLDLFMPELDGLETARELRARGYRMPIVGLTASAVADDQQRCLDAGMDRVLAKPLGLPALRRALWELVLNA